MVALALLVLLAALLAAASAGVVRRRWRLWRLVEKLPGPAALPVVGNTYMGFLSKREDRMRVMEEMYKKYWPIFRLWLGPYPSINVVKPEHVGVVLSSSELIDKSLFYSFLQPWLGEGLLISTGSKWRHRRKMITPAFHFKMLHNFVGIYAENTEILVKKLMPKANGKPFDIFPYISLCTLDIICETVMGTSVNAQEQTDSAYTNAVHRINEITTERALSPWLYPDFIFKRSRLGKEYYHQRNIVHSFSKKVISERKLAHESKEWKTFDEDYIGERRCVAFLDLLLDASANGQKLTDQELQEEVDTFMFGGHDTASLATLWTVVLLGQHPDIQDKVFAEVSDILGEDESRRPTMGDLNDMKYLEMVIKEALRLYPPANIISRQVMKDVEVGGYHIPAGCMVTLNLQQTHRDPEHWPHPQRFDPDNFLPESAKQRHPFAFLPFSAGPRNCIGQKFAMLEVKSVVSRLLRAFRLEALEGGAVPVAAGFMTRPLGAVHVRLSLRNKPAPPPPPAALCVTSAAVTNTV